MEVRFTDSAQRWQRIKEGTVPPLLRPVLLARRISRVTVVLFIAGVAALAGHQHVAIGWPLMVVLLGAPILYLFSYLSWMLFLSVQMGRTLGEEIRRQGTALRRSIRDTSTCEVVVRLAPEGVYAAWPGSDYLLRWRDCRGVRIDPGGVHFDRDLGAVTIPTAAFIDSSQAVGFFERAGALRRGAPT